MESMTENSSKFSLHSLQIPASVAASIVAVVIVGVFFITDKYQSKEDARKLEMRIEKVEALMSAMGTGINQIQSDVSYIKGRMEPKNKN